MSVAEHSRPAPAEGGAPAGLRRLAEQVAATGARSVRDERAQTLLAGASTPDLVYVAAFLAVR